MYRWLSNWGQTTVPAATRHRRSSSWCAASTTASSTRCCSASPGRARPSPWPRSSRPAAVRRWCWRTTRRWPRSSTTSSRRSFPTNAVEYFVSYYDYYQPEAYIPASDVYIEKEATINDELDKLRLSATRSLFERRDCVIVASVSCIYGLGLARSLLRHAADARKGAEDLAQGDHCRKLVEILYERNDGDFRRGTFRVRGDVIEVFPTYDDYAYRIELWGDEVESLSQIDPLLGQVKQTYLRLPIYPKTHYVMSAETEDEGACDSIEQELEWWHAELEKQGKLIEAQRLYQRTMFDLEMIKEIGYCHGIENYSRHFSGTPAGRGAAHAARLPAARRADVPRRKPPDRSATARHVSRRPLAQGDAGGVRLPPAQRARQPAADLRGVRAPREPGGLRLGDAGPVRADQDRRAWWWSRSSGPPAWSIPTVEIRPVKGQVDDLLDEIRKRAENNERVLVTTLTKRMAEDLAEYYSEVGRALPLPALGGDARSTASRSCATCAAASSTC